MSTAPAKSYLLVEDILLELVAGALASGCSGTQAVERAKEALAALRREAKGAQG